MEAWRITLRLTVISDWLALAKFSAQMLPRWRWKLFLLFLLGCGQIFFAVKIPLIGAQIIDALTWGVRARFEREVTILAVCVLAQAVISWCASLLSLVLEEGTAQVLRHRTLQAYLKSEPESVDRYSAGDVISRIANDCTSLKNLPTQIVLPPLWDLGMIVVVAAVLIRMQPVLAIFTMLTAPCAMVVSQWIRPRMEAATAKVRVALAGMLGCLQTWLSDIFAVKVHRIERACEASFIDRNVVMRRTAISAGRLQVLQSAFNVLLLGMPSLLIFSYGGLHVLSGSLTVGTLFAFMSLSSLLNSPIQREVQLLAIAVPTSTVIRRRCEEMLALVPETEGKISSSDSVEYVRIENATISRSSTFELEIPEFSAKRGDVVGLTGPNGSGKSTLGRVIAGVYKPLSGKASLVLSDGSEQVSASRSVTAILPQKPSLFEGTLLENICLFDVPDVARVKHVAEIVGLSSWVETLPERWDTMIRPELVNGFSGGQVQRIGLARVLYEGRPVTFLDEPTRGLDRDAEVVLRALLEECRARGSVIVATHSQEVLDLCGPIYEMRQDDRHTWRCGRQSCGSTVVDIASQGGVTDEVIAGGLRV